MNKELRMILFLYAVLALLAIGVCMWYLRQANRRLEKSKRMDELMRNMDLLNLDQIGADFSGVKMPVRIHNPSTPEEQINVLNGTSVTLFVVFCLLVVLAVYYML